MTEIDENTTTVPQELLDNPETNKALTNVEESAMSKGEMLAYDDFWDKMGAERLLFVDSNRISREEGRKEGREEGREEGRKAGIEEEKIASAKRLLAMGLSPEQVASGVDLSIEEVKKLIE